MRPPRQPADAIRPADEVPADAALAGRLDALEDALTLLGRHGFQVPPDLVGDQVAHARARLRHGTHHTVVALVGSTGSGKSSLLNALVGAEVAGTGVTRPTTSITQAVTIGADASGLLDLIGVTRRHRIAALDGHSPDGEDRLDGLVLLDLPDFDSVAVAHRLEVDRLITLVDALVWVTDPQKYADETLHDGYLRRYRSHAEVMQVVLNKTDTVPPAQVATLVQDLSRLLARDGLTDLTPVTTSATTPGGVADLRALLADQVSARRAALARIDADLRRITEALGALARVAQPDGSSLPATLGATTADGLAAAAGVDHIAALVAAQHRRDARLATGWPPLRWIRRLRRAPLARLQTTTGSQVATAEVSRTLRATAAAAADTAGPQWADAAAAAVRGQVEEVSAALDQQVSRDVQVLRQPPRWWRAVGVAHRLLLLVALAGAVWLGGIAATQALLLVDPRPFTPHLGVVPVPTVLLLSGLAGGIVLALLAAVAARIGARRQARRATASLRRAVAEVTEDHVIGPLQTVLADRDQVSQLLDVAGGAPAAGAAGGARGGSVPGHA